MTIEAASATGLLEAARKAKDIAGRHAALADREGRLSEDLVAAVREAGFARHLVPARHGGAEGTFSELTRAVTALAGDCAAAGWFASLSAYSGRFAAYLPQDGQEELWAVGPDVFIATGLVPSGVAEPAEGGWRLSGEWRYVSGAEFADWVLLCGPTPSDGRGAARFFAIPASAGRVVESWDSAGMRATGSHTFAVSEVFVPEYRTVPRGAALAGPNPLHSAVCHNTPFRAVGTLTFVAPALGGALGALGSAIELVREGRRTSAGDEGLARAAGLIDAARLLIERNAATADTGRFAPADLARNERDAATAAELLVSSVQSLVRAAGTRGLSQARPLERFWRDVTCAASHVALRFETAPAKNYADAVLDA